MNSKRKGKRGELEAAEALRAVLGCEARRGQQFQGSPDSPDVVTNIDGVFFEAKRRQRFDLYRSMHQATEDADHHDIPVVLQRRNLERWVAICWLDDLPELAKILADYIRCHAIAKGDSP
mgnify:CR=1 FL=1